ncbi:MAG: hypothetical protein WAK82_37840 [Streptosporangiaceae bacterium]
MTPLEQVRPARCGAPALMFGPKPATHDHCTLGGVIGNNSCGPHMASAHRPERISRGPHGDGRIVGLRGR